MEQINFAILAGGNGKRLRPICDIFTPKPFIEITPGKSLLRYSFDQVKRIMKYRMEDPDESGNDKVTLVVLEKFLDRALTEVNRQVDYTITEHSTQNTFNAILRLVMSLEDSPNQMLCILPCDQIIDNLRTFSEAISQAAVVARTNNSICLIATKPTKVSDQFGYIKSSSNGLIESFFEKPSLVHAQEIIQDGALVNTSTIVATVGAIKEAINAVSSKPDFVFQQQSFDAVVLQKNPKPMFVVKSDHFFIDVGTPESFVAGKEFIGKNCCFASEQDNQDRLCSRKHDSETCPEVGEQALYFAEYKVRKLLELIPEMQNHALKILDFGCGDGVMTEMLKRYFIYSEVSGCDISNINVNIARQWHEQIKFFTLGSRGDDLGTNSYDLIIASEVFHHIAPKEHKFWLKKIESALTKNGVFILFELNPLNPFVRYAFKNDATEKNSQMLWPLRSKRVLSDVFGKKTNLNFFAFFQVWFKFLRFLEPFLRKCPFGGIFACVVKK